MTSLRWTALVMGLLAFGACGGSSTTGADNVSSSADDLTASGQGEKLFDHETFDGNGRTCQTCHSEFTGTTSPFDAVVRYFYNSNDPLFRSIDSNDGQGNNYSRLLKEATIRVAIPLPSDLSLVDYPSAKSVIFNRGIPTVFNTPALDPVLMLDGREPDLVSQARDAIKMHFQASENPTTTQLQDIAIYEKTLFTSTALAKYANGGSAPQLPQPNNASEARGKVFFEDNGLCGQCHGGPMLNTMTQYSNFGPPGSRFADVAVSELNEGNQPLHNFLATLPDGSQMEVAFSDPGRAMITGDLANDVGAFKISPLWGISRTAPYFHDNSAATLSDVVNHYQEIFSQPGPGAPPIIITDQNKADMIAYMMRL